MNIPDIPLGASNGEAALLYARAGIPVFPCDSNKEPVGKFAPNGFKNATTNETLIAFWWGQLPDANIGSPLDDHTIALDVDDTQKAKPVTDLLPQTGPIQITGRATPDNPKHHRLYDLNGHDPTGLITVKAELGIETKGLNKGYILLAPSLTTNAYHWQQTGPTEPIPDALYDVLTGKRTKAPPNTPKEPGEPVITVTGGPCAKWCDRTDAIQRDPGGYRYMNDYAFHRVKYHRDTTDWMLTDALLPLIGRMEPPYPGNEASVTIQKIVSQMVEDIANGKVAPDGPSQWQQAGGETNTRRDIGSATANDLPQGSPPDLLLSPWLHPEETTIIYGPGGVGKGVTAAWLTQQLVAAEHTVMVLDYEYHPREWGNRLDGLQMTADEKDHVHYRAPYGQEWGAKTGTLIEVWDLVREDADRLGVTYVVVDSYTPATGDDDRMGGQGAAQQFAQAASRIGRPMLVLAHVASMAGRFPDKPFGSVHVRNLVARRQWAVESNGDTPAAHPLTEPSVIRLEFRNTKGNDYAKAKPRHVTISFWPLGLIEVTDEEDAKPSVEFLIDAVLDRPLPIGDIRKAIREDFRDTEPPTEAVIDVTLRRHPEKYVIDRTAKRPFPWAKVEAEEAV